MPFRDFETACRLPECGTKSTSFYCAGLNYYLRGHNAKVSLDYSFVDQEDSNLPDQPVVTVQVAIGF